LPSLRWRAPHARAFNCRIPPLPLGR
jgi:hypothetical protein